MQCGVLGAGGIWPKYLNHLSLPFNPLKSDLFHMKLLLEKTLTFYWSSVLKQTRQDTFLGHSESKWAFTSLLLQNDFLGSFPSTKKAVQAQAAHQDPVWLPNTLCCQQWHQGRQQVLKLMSFAAEKEKSLSVFQLSQNNPEKGPKAKLYLCSFSNLC